MSASSAMVSLNCAHTMHTLVRLERLHVSKCKAGIAIHTDTSLSTYSFMAASLDLPLFDSQASLCL